MDKQVVKWCVILLESQQSLMLFGIKNFGWGRWKAKNEYGRVANISLNCDTVASRTSLHTVDALLQTGPLNVTKLSKMLLLLQVGL